MRVTHSAKTNAVGEIACVAMPPWSSRVSVHAVLAIMVGFACGSAHGQTWGTNTTGTWATGANWVGSSAPATTGTATFASTNAARTITLGADTTIAGLVFTNTNSTSFVNDGTLRSLSIGSRGITLNGTSGDVSLGSIANPINVAISSGQSFTNNSTNGTLTLNGTISRVSTAGSAMILTVAGVGNTAFTGQLVNGGTNSNLALVKNGSGTLTFNGSGTSTFTNNTSLNAGVLAIDFVNSASGTNVFSASSTVNFGGGSMTLKGKNSGPTSQTLSAITITGSNGGSILVDPNGGTSTTVALGAITRNVGSSLLLGQAINAGAGTLTMTTTSNKDAAGIYGSRVVWSSGVANTGYDWATTASGGSPYTLGGLSSYSALATAGTDTNNSRITSSASLSGNVTTNTLKIDNPATSQSLALGGNTLTLTGGGLLITGSNEFTVSGNAGSTGLTAGNGVGAYELIVQQYSSAAATISAPIGDNGVNTVGLTKAGPGTLVVSGSNTYTGPTVVNGGILAAGASGGAFGSNSVVTVATGGTLQTAGFTNAVGSLSGTTGGIVENGSATAGSLSIAGNNSTWTFGGLLQDGAGGGALSLVKNGSGQVTLSGSNTFTGGSQINSGTLVAGNGSALGTGTVTLAGGVLQIPVTTIASTPTFANAIAVSGSGTVRAPDLSGISGPVTGGPSETLTLLAPGNNRVTITSNFSGLSGTLVIDQLGTSQNVNLSGAGKDLSTAKVSLQSTSVVSTQDSGASNIQFGELTGVAGTRIGSVNSASPTFIVGAVNTSSTFAGIINQTSTGIASLTKVGTGVLALTGSNTYTGATTVSNGVLRFNSQFALPGGLGAAISGSSSALTIAGGVIGLGFDDFLRPLGTGSNAVQWTGAGGFAAYTADRNVNLGGASAGVTWASGNFVPTGSALILGHTTADKTVTFLNPIALNGATRIIDVQDGTAAVDAVVSGAISGGASDGLTKNGAGWLALSGNNTYGGMTTVNAGGLAMNGSLAGAVTVQSGGILGGSGTIEGPVSILDGGIIAPGNSPATLTVNDVFTLGSTSILDFELSGSDQTVGGGVNDLISGVTDLTLDGILNVTALTSFTSATAGMKWRLFSYSGALTNNTLSLGSMPTLSAGNSFSIDTSQTGQVNLVIVPEPAGWLMAAVGIGVAGLTLAKRKRIAADRRHG